MYQGCVHGFALDAVISACNYDGFWRPVWELFIGAEVVLEFLFPG